MAAALVGANIAALRKAKGVKQEDVARAVGVSAQAVSKWENGGTPDIELLPLVADYFGVSIDRLFGRTIRDFGDMESEVTNYIAQPLDTHEGDPEKIPDELHAAAMERAREICWAVNLGLNGTKIFEKLGFSAKHVLEEIQKNSSGDIHLYSQISNNAGVALMSLSRNLPYYMLFPEPEHGWDAELLGLEEYSKAFAVLAEPDMLHCLHLVHTKEPEKKFTLGHFAKLAGLETGRAEEVLKTLADTGYAEISTLDLDDAQQTFYSIKLSHIFIMIQVLMRTYIEPPKAAIQFNVRSRPFLHRKGEDK